MRFRAVEVADASPFGASSARIPAAFPKAALAPGLPAGGARLGISEEGKH
jgi:hypothetical protein